MPEINAYLKFIIFVYAGREGRTSLARPNSQAQTGARKKSSVFVQLATTRIGERTRLISSLML